jgi:hypothetical protein
MLVHEETGQAFADPRPGDHFTEMFAFHVFVLRVYPDNGSVVVMEASAPCELPKDGKIRTFKNPEEFRNTYSYSSSVPGYWVRLCRRGANVSGWVDDDNAPLWDQGVLA